MPGLHPMRALIKILIPSLFFAFAALGQQPDKALTKEDIVRMVQQGLPTVTIVDAIHKAPEIGFTSATPEERAEMERQGIPRQVTQAMVDRLQTTQVMLDEMRKKNSAGKPKSRFLRHGNNAWYLEPGRVEAWGQFGVNGWWRDPLPYASWSSGGGVAVGVRRMVAFTGEYNYNNILDGSIRFPYHGVYYTSVASGGFHDALGSIRVSTPGRIAAYGTAGLGLVTLRATATNLPVIGTVGGHFTEGAMAFGGGLKAGINHGVGFQADVRFLRPLGLNNILDSYRRETGLDNRGVQWYGRATLGVYFRF